MSVQPIPPPIEHLGQRPFSFYPPILNTEHNEWIFRRATWSEILVCNTKTNNEIWVPRRFIGEISRIEEPVMILGLLKELEYKIGQVLPLGRRVIEIPRAVNDGFRAIPQDVPSSPAPVVGIRLESGTESRIGKLIGVVLVVGILGCFLLVQLLPFGAGRDPHHLFAGGPNESGSGQSRRLLRCRAKTGYACQRSLEVRNRRDAVPDPQLSGSGGFRYPDGCGTRQGAVYRGPRQELASN